VPSQTSVFSDPRFRADPYRFYDQLRGETAAYRTTLPNGNEVFVLTRFGDVEAALKDPRLVKNIRNARDATPGVLARLGLAHHFANANMLRADPPEHTRLRALVHQAFTPRLVSAMRDLIQSIADQLIDAVKPAGHMDLIRDFAFPLPITVICEMLGVPQADEQKFRRWSTAFIASGALSSESPPIVPSLLLLVRYVCKLIRERRKQAAPTDGLIGQLLQARDGGDRLNERELISTLILLLIAGHETTVNLIGNGMLALLLDRAQLERLQQTPDLIKGTVEELLRFVNPVQLVNRYASEDVEIGGVQLPRGSHLVLILAAANHDPAFVAGADHLDVERSAKQHVAFSQGIHYCLGAPLARLEGEIAFSTLLRRLPNIRLDVAPEILSWRPSLELRGLNALPVTF
jgi:cytochrome P450